MGTCADLIGGEAPSGGPADEHHAEVDALVEEWQRILAGTRHAIGEELEHHDELVKEFLRKSCSTVGASEVAVRKVTSKASKVSRTSSGAEPSLPSKTSPGLADLWEDKQTAVTLGVWEDNQTAVTLGHRHRQTSSVKEKQVTPMIDKGAVSLGNGWARRSFKATIDAVHWFQALEEPRREGSLAAAVNSKPFESLSAVAILVNCIFTLWVTNDAIFRVSTGMPPESAWSVLGEQVFTTFFACEITAKLCVHRLHFFVNDDMGWNWLDFFLVATSTMNLVIDQLLSAQSINVSFLRAFRLLKITRILRMLRILKFCRKLRVMLDALINSTQSLIWVILLLILLFGIFSLLFVQLITPYIEDHYGEECSEDTTCASESLVYYFGSVFRGVISLYMSTTGGLNWHILWDMLAKTSPVNAGVFLLFTLVFYFCVFNLLTGMFVDQAVKAAQPDRDMVIFEQRSKEGAQIAELRRICLEFDDNADGEISWEEFMSMIQNDKILFWLAAFGLDIADAKMFFKMLLTAGEGEVVPIDTFVQGCMRMKGEATSIDLQALIFQVQTLSHRQNGFQESVQSALDALTASSSSALGDLATTQPSPTPSPRDVPKVSVAQNLYGASKLVL